MNEQEQMLLELQKAMTKMVNESVDLKLLNDKLKSDNKDLRTLLIRWERENESLQQSLDDCQGELEREWELAEGEGR